MTLASALSDPEVAALGDQTTNYLTQRQGNMRTQLLDVLVTTELMGLSVDQTDEQKKPQLAQLAKTEETLRRGLAAIEGALNNTPVPAPPALQQPSQ